MQELFTTGAGLVIIAVTISEVFKDLFHPTSGGALSDWLGRLIFSLLRRRPRSLPLAGPLTLMLVLASWVFLLVLGFALWYYGHFPQDFRTSTAQVPRPSPQFLTCLYFSFETLITLGYGDFIPQTTMMQFASSSEALIGFGLLTASVSSVVLLYPALSRMRALARGVAHIVAAERVTGMSLLDTNSDLILASLAREVTDARIDLVHFPIVYYFAPTEEAASVAHWVPELVRLARAGLSDHLPKHVRFAAAALDASLDDLAAILAQRFISQRLPDRDAVFRAFAYDHAIDPA
jgi:hypothetical protein